MKITLIKEKLREVLQVVDRICARRGDLTILNFFHLRAVNGRVTVYATDLELAYEAEVAGRIEHEGEVLLPARQFMQLLEGIGDDMLTLERGERNLVVRGERSISTIAGLIEEEYPLPVEVKRERRLEIESTVLDEALGKVSTCLRTAELFKPELAGVYWQLTDQHLTLVATDTLRLTEAKIRCQFFESNAGDVKLLVPKKLIQEYLGLRRKPHKVKVYLEPHQVTFDLEHQHFTVKLMSADYPDYRRIIPDNFLLTFHLEREAFAKALKLNKVFLDQTKEVRLRVQPKENTLEIYSRNELLGDTTTTLPIQIKEQTLSDHETFEVRFNHEFLQDGVATATGDTLFLGLNLPTGDQVKPLVIRDPLDEDYTYLLMPL